MTKKMHSHPAQGMSSKPPSLVTRAVRVAIRSAEIRARPEGGLEESPGLLRLAQILTQRAPKVLAGRWKAESIIGLDNSYSFLLFPESDLGELADLDQILLDARRRLDRAVASLEDKARSGEVAALSAMRISPAEAAFLECVLEVQQLAGKVELGLEATSHEDVHEVEDGAEEGAATRARRSRSDTCFVVQPPTPETLCAIGRPSLTPVPLHGIVAGVQDLATGTALIINNSRSIPVQGLTREKATELFVDRAEIRGVVVQIAGESVLTEVVWQQKLDLESNE